MESSKNRPKTNGKIIEERNKHFYKQKSNLNTMKTDIDYSTNESNIKTIKMGNKRNFENDQDKV